MLRAQIKLTFRSSDVLTCYTESVHTQLVLRANLPPLPAITGSGAGCGCACTNFEAGHNFKQYFQRMYLGKRYSQRSTLIYHLRGRGICGISLMRPAEAQHLNVFTGERNVDSLEYLTSKLQIWGAGLNRRKMNKYLIPQFSSFQPFDCTERHHAYTGGTRFDRPQHFLYPVGQYMFSAALYHRV